MPNQWPAGYTRQSDETKICQNVKCEQKYKRGKRSKEQWLKSTSCSKRCMGIISSLRGAENRQRAFEARPYCLCGCGEQVSDVGNTYIFGHSTRQERRKCSVEDCLNLVTKVTAKYCSNECSGRGRQVTKRCVQCNGKIPHKPGGKRITCSVDCLEAEKRKSLAFLLSLPFKECKWCTKPISKDGLVLSAYNAKQFCDRDCSGKYNHHWKTFLNIKIYRMCLNNECDQWTSYIASWPSSAPAGYCRRECADLGRRVSVTPEETRDATAWPYRYWRDIVSARDRVCQTCINPTGSLHAHHIKRWALFPEKRFAIDNGILICSRCHKDVHR